MKDFIKEHKWWSIAIAIALVLIAYLGLTKGLGGVGQAFKLMAGIFMFSSFFQGYAHEEGKGCAPILLTLALAVLCFFISKGFDMLNELRQREREEAAAYEKLMRNPTVGDCEFFVNTYRNSERKEEVMSVYLKLAEQGGLNGLNEFYNNYAGTPWGEKADQRRRQICDSLYSVADSTNTVTAWKNYQEVVPSDFFADSQHKIDSLEDLRWKTDEVAWKTANEENTAAAYQKYMEMYPQGRHCSQADKKLIDAQVSDIMAGEHGSLGSMDRASYGYGPTSTVTIKNSTSYTMTILYSGPDSKRLVLSPHETGSVKLKNGRYSIAASVSDAKVRRYAGTENLQGGAYSSEYYISSSYVPSYNKYR